MTSNMGEWELYEAALNDDLLGSQVESMYADRELGIEDEPDYTRTYSVDNTTQNGEES